MTIPTNGIQAAHAEARSEGTLAVDGKVVVFRNQQGSVVRKFWAATPKDAEQQLRLFRAALKYPATANV